MKVENSGYFPVRSLFSKGSINNEQKKIIMEIVDTEKQIIRNNEESISIQKESISIQKESISILKSQMECIKKCMREIIQIQKKRDDMLFNVIQDLERSSISAMPCAAEIAHTKTIKDVTQSAQNGVAKSVLSPVQQLAIVKRANNAYVAASGSIVHPPIKNNEAIFVASPNKENEFIKNVRELGATLHKEKIDWYPNSTPLVNEFKVQYDDLMNNRKENNQRIRNHEKSILEKKKMLERYNCSISGYSIVSRKEEDTIDKIVSEILVLEKEIESFKQINHFQTQEYLDLLKNAEKQKLQNIIEEHKAEDYDINQQDVLRTADFLLDICDYRGALKEYTRILKSKKDNAQKVSEDYIPLSETLRQASMLYLSLKPMVDAISNLDSNIKLDLLASAISAHSFGKFGVSKSQAIDMISKDFYYPAQS